MPVRVGVVIAGLGDDVNPLAVLIYNVCRVAVGAVPGDDAAVDAEICRSHRAAKDGFMVKLGL